ncbi:glycosyltransferase family 4 protein [Georgenia satyanarayanai]|uniref:glycosyltransferase family 4 protein n=1 Tax=Georgenia satyanarayanai TaxID=860221 RepID=UPI0015E89159|nr:glycosyltransferase family 4 protein [Georgenia satyanarayanai]
MHVTYIHQHFRRPDQPGGTRSWEFARRLASDGHEVTMICAGAQRRTYVTDGFTVRQLPVPYRNSLSFAGRIRAFFGFMILASIEAVRTPGDVILATSTPLTVAIPALIASKARRRPFVFEVRDLWPQVPIELGYLRNRTIIRLAQALERAAYRGATQIVALSPSMAAGVLRIAPRKPVTTIPNSSDIDRFKSVDASEAADLRRELGIGADEALILYAGSLGESYEVDWLVDLAASLPDDSVHVVVAGDGTTRPTLEAQVQRLGLEDRVHLLGPRPKAFIAGLYAASDVVASSLRDHPSLEGNSLNKVFDALAAGKPVIFNHGGWLAQLLSTEGAGWRLSRSTESAAEELTALLQDPRLLAEAGERAHAIALSDFNRDTHYANLKRVLLAAEGRRK